MKRIEPMYISCENLDFTWQASELKQMKELWQEGVSMWDIAKRMKRNPMEVINLSWDLLEKGLIERRA